MTASDGPISARDASGVITSRSLRNRRRLNLRIAALAAWCALPFAGLAFYFLSTGLHHDIDVAERERTGVRHLAQTITVLDQAVQVVWSEKGDDTEILRSIERDFATLHALESQVAGGLSAGALNPRGGPAAVPTSAQIQASWQAIVEAPKDSTARKDALQRLVRQLHEGIFHTSDRVGLGSGPETEVNGLTDVVAFSLPLHVERLLHMHERMAEDLRSGKWDEGTREAAAIFARQIEQEDVARLNRSVTAALRGDAGSEQVAQKFQDDFPPQATAFLAALQRLAETMHAATTGTPTTRSDEFDLQLRGAFDTAIHFWEQALEHLDHLITAKIALARQQRNRALFVAGTVLGLMVPVAWVYFRRLIRPVLHDMVAEAAEVQQQAEAARAEADESTRRLKEIQAALDDHCAVTVFDPEGRILSINDQMVALSGYGREDLVGRLVPFIDAPAHPAGLLDGMWEHIRKGQLWHGNIRCRTRNGRPFWLAITIFPLVDRAGNAREFIAIQTDITELVHARESAEGAARAKSQFLAMMSHEIRTPMNGVLGFAHLLADSSLDDQQRDYVRTILTSGEALLTIINDVLDFSKLEAGRTELESRPLALRLLLEDVIDLLAPTARAKKLELVYRLSPGVPDGFVGDETRLRQVLLNLVGNAVKFTTTGHVEIVVEPDAVEPEGANRIAFHVRDTGAGIPADRLDRLFKAFSQVDASVTRTHGGTGLGLAISQRLVGLMGGEIVVRSKVGAGSDFFFSLPVQVADVGHLLRARAPTLAPEIERALRNRRILVVDDLPANLRLFERILAQYGATVTAIGAPAEALALVGRERFDLAVLDYMMPMTDGITLARAIRNRTTPPLPCVLATSDAPAKADLPDGLFAAILLKPIRNVQLAAAAAQVFVGDKLPASAPRVVPGSSPNFAAANPLRILAVDDNPVNLKVLAATLASFGYVPDLFHAAPPALARLRDQDYDLVLMDVQMPDLDGLEATRQLRAGAAGERNRRCRVVALTAGALAEEREACLAAGMDDFVAKPIPRSVLLEKLAEAAAGVKTAS